jgi:hypothetical protein
VFISIATEFIGCKTNHHPMKTVTKLALAGLTAALVIPTGVFANDSEWMAVDNHHGSVIYLHRPKQEETTIAFYGHGKGIGRVDSNKTERSDLRPMQVSTVHGPVTFYGPAK